MRNKRPIPEFLLKDKREGAYLTGLPLIGVTPESGVVYGGSVQWYDNGSKDSPFFSYAPYRKKINATLAFGTKGRQEYILEYDQPYIADSPWRVRASAAYLVYEFEDYFGVGKETLGRLSFPGTPGVTYARADDYFDALKENRGGQNWARYNYYDRRQIAFAVNVERDYLGGLLRPLVGFQVSHVDVRDYTGAVVDGAVNQETKLREDSRTGRIQGFDGGWLNLLRVGLTYDSRDYEPDPTSGVLGQVLFEGTTRWLGADSDFGHVTVGLQGYYPCCRTSRDSCLRGTPSTPPTSAIRRSTLCPAWPCRGTSARRGWAAGGRSAGITRTDSWATWRCTGASSSAGASWISRSWVRTSNPCSCRLWMRAGSSTRSDSSA